MDLDLHILKFVFVFPLLSSGSTKKKMKGEINLANIWKVLEGEHYTNNASHF